MRRNVVERGGDSGGVHYEQSVWNEEECEARGCNMCSGAGDSWGVHYEQTVTVSGPGPQELGRASRSGRAVHVDPGISQLTTPLRSTLEIET